MEEIGIGVGFLARPWLTADRWLPFGRYVQLMREVMMADSSFFNYMRMKTNIFDEILNRVGLESERVTPKIAQLPLKRVGRSEFVTRASSA